MKYFKLKSIAFLAIAFLALVSCQKENLNEQSLLKSEAQRPELPNLTVVSAEEMPEGANLTARAANNITAYNVQGRYMGKLYDVTMKGERKDDVQNIPVDITATGSNTFTFLLNEFKVGKMPGYLSCKIEGLTLNADGTFHATNTGKDVELRIPNVRTFEYDVTLIEGRFTPVYGGYNLKFTLESEGKWWVFTIFKAHVKYDGDQQ